MIHSLKEKMALQFFYKAVREETDDCSLSFYSFKLYLQ